MLQIPTKLKLHKEYVIILLLYAGVYFVPTFLIKRESKLCGF